MRGDLAVLVPSFGRPDAVAGLAKRIVATATAKTALIVAVDLDDPTHLDYPAIAADAPDFAGLLVLEHTANAAEALNLVACRYAPGARYLAYLPDSWRPVTHGWDKALVDALDAGHALARGHEVVTMTRAAPRHIAMRSEIVESLEYMVPPGMPAERWSDVWSRWGTAAGMASCHDVVFTRDASVLPRPARRVDPDAPSPWQQYTSSGQCERDAARVAVFSRRSDRSTPA